MKRRLVARLFVITTLLMTSMPRWATAQVLKGSRQNQQQFEQLLLIVKDAERLARNAEVRNELKQATSAIEEAAAAIKNGTTDHSDGMGNRGSNGREDQVSATPGQDLAKIDGQSWRPRYDNGGPDLSRARSLLRHIVDEPRDEGLDLQEKVAEALKVLDESAAAMWGDGSSNANTETAFGLHTTTFDTLQGTVTANLPDDLTAGDTISGTVIAEAKGKTPEEKAQNPDQLNGYVVELEKQPAPVDNKVAKWAIPTATAAAIPLVLKNREGNVVARTMIPVDPPAQTVRGSAAPNPIANPGKAGSAEAGNHPGESNIGGGPHRPVDNQSRTSIGLLHPSETGGGTSTVLGAYAIPALAQAGRAIAVKGLFDGDLTTSAIKIANQAVPVLAESPRQVVAATLPGVTGKAEIEVKKRDRVVAKCSFVSLGIRLSAAKLNLVRGETTTMTVTVLGGDGMSGPVQVSLVNQSPWVVRMEGGQRQRLTFDPKQFSGGTAKMERTLTGLRAGGFAINASLASTASYVRPGPPPPPITPQSQSVDPRAASTAHRPAGADGASPDAYDRPFIAKDDTGRTRTATLRIVVQ